MRIRTLFLASVVTAALPGLCAGAWLAVADWTQWSNALDAVAATQVVSTVRRAQTALAVETGQFNAGFLAIAPDYAAIQALGQRTDTLLDAAARSAVAAGLDAMATDAVASGLGRLRQGFREVASKPAEQRDPAFPQTVTQQRGMMTGQLNGLAGLAARRIQATLPSVTAAVDVAALVTEMRDSSGRRRSILNGWLLGKPVTLQDLADAERLTGRITAAAASAGPLIAALADPPGLTAAFGHLDEDRVRDETRYRAVMDGAGARASAVLGAVPAPWPEDQPGFMAWSTKSLAALTIPLDAALDLALASSKVSADAGSRQVIIDLILAAVTGLLSIGSIILLLRQVVLPLQRLTGAVERIAAADLLAEIPDLARRDEIGAMAQALQVLKDNARAAQLLQQEHAAAREHRAAEDAQVRRQAEDAAAADAAALVVGSIGLGLAKLAAGDLTFRVTGPLPAAYEKLRADLNAAMDQLQAMVRSIVGRAAALRSGTDEISQASDDLSRRTENQAASLEQTAAALDQITATVRKTAEGAKLARSVVDQTKIDAEHSGAVVRKAVAAMGAIEASSQQIGQIIGVIDEIAFQTNLLALNAGIEAARAGDFGRGFAVVATEVRALAQRSSDAAKEIKALVSASALQVDAGVKLVDETGRALGRIMAQVTEVTIAVSEIAASAQEQSTALAEVNTAINQMDQVTQQNAAMVEQATAASHALAQETAGLVGMTERFDLGAEGAPGEVQAIRRAPPRLAKAALRVVGQGGAARKAVPDPGDWEEF